LQIKRITAHGRTELWISDDFDWELFDRVASALP